jgi:predicted metal-dependent phosphotriesterase family hydrolase
MGKIQTLNGPVAAGELGAVLPHGTFLRVERPLPGA